MYQQIGGNNSGKPLREPISIHDFCLPKLETKVFFNFDLWASFKEISCKFDTFKDWDFILNAKKYSKT